MGFVHMTKDKISEVGQGVDGAEGRGLDIPNPA